VGYSHFVTEYALRDNLGEHVKLTEVDYEKDLVVWISSDLKSSLHCIKAVASAMRVLASYDQKGICQHLERAGYLSFFTGHMYSRI